MPDVLGPGDTYTPPPSLMKKRPSFIGFMKRNEAIIDNSNPITEEELNPIENAQPLKPRSSFRGLIKRYEGIAQNNAAGPGADDSLLKRKGSVRTTAKLSDPFIENQPTNMRKRMSIVGSMLSGSVSRDSTSSSPTVPNTICPRCSKEIKDTYQTFDNKRYHNECVTCTTCKTKIVEAVFTQKDDIYCKQCFYHEKGLICETCSKPIMGDYIVVNEKKYHSNCRTCSVCKAVIKGKEHSVLGNSIFCAEHRDTITCYACHKKIDGEVVEVFGINKGIR
jgi:hypothetical protein